LVQEESVDVYTVRLTQILGDERADRGQVLFFQRVRVLYILDFWGQRRFFAFWFGGGFGCRLGGHGDYDCVWGVGGGAAG